MRKIWALAALAAGMGLTSMASAASSLISDANAHAGQVTIDSTGHISVTTVAGNYDGVEDVVYNVVNQSSHVIGPLIFTGAGLGLLDRDGIDNYANADGSTVSPSHYGSVINGGVDPFDYAGYANTTNTANAYSAVSANSVTVTFAGGAGLAAGQSGFVSFEEPTTLNGQINITAAPLPASAWAGLALLGLIGAVKLSKRAGFSF